MGACISGLATVAILLGMSATSNRHADTLSANNARPAQPTSETARGAECVPDYVHGISGSGYTVPVGTIQINALKVWDDGNGPALYAAGKFSTINGVPVGNIAKWDGTAWSAIGDVGNPMSAQRINVLEVFDDGNGECLYIGGSFASVNGDTDMKNLAKWNGTQMLPVVPVGSVVTNFPIDAMTTGNIGNGHSLFVGTSRFVYWTNGGPWTSANANFNNGTTIEALAVFVKGGTPYLYVGGNMSTMAGQPAQGIARWNGSAWSWTGNFNQFGVVRTLHVHNDGTGPALYAGGNFTSIPSSSLAANRIARLPQDGTGTANWQALGTGAADIPGCSGCASVWDIATFDDGTGPALYIVGAFTSVNGVTAPHIAKWQGGQWHSVGNGGPGGTTPGSLTAYATTITTHETCGPLTPNNEPALFFGGPFLAVNGESNDRLGMYQGCPTDPNSAPGDLNHDGVVDVLDLLILLSSWGDCASICDCVADINNDGVVDVLDLLILLGNWGTVG